MEQNIYIKRPGEHGGAHSAGTRRSRRPLSTRHSLHVTLRSVMAYGPRSLIRHRTMVEEVIRKAGVRFHITIYNFAVCGNHLHLHIRGRTRVNLQNFFRVVAGHIAQSIVRQFPVSERERRWAGSAQSGCEKNRRVFWHRLLWSRIVGWGREFVKVTEYVMTNTLEAMDILPYKPRRSYTHQNQFSSG